MDKLEEDRKQIAIVVFVNLLAEKFFFKVNFCCLNRLK